MVPIRGYTRAMIKTMTGTFSNLFHFRLKPFGKLNLGLITLLRNFIKMNLILRGPKNPPFRLQRRNQRGRVGQDQERAQGTRQRAGSQSQLHAAVY